jgi:hypothetical protein
MKVHKKKPRIGVLVLVVLVLWVVGLARGRLGTLMAMPSRDVEGPLQLLLETDDEAPIGHSPADRWRTHHREALARGDFTEEECRACHHPENYCNRCHNYVGVKRIEGERIQ